MKGLLSTLALVGTLAGLLASNHASGSVRPSHFGPAATSTSHSDLDSVMTTGSVEDTQVNRAAPEKKIPGFRVQLYQGSSRARAKEIRDLMVQSYPKLGVYMGYRQPDFRVRVGDFRDKGEATAYLNMMKSDFPSAFVVPDKVLLYPKTEQVGEPTLEQDGYED
ncbi:MAG: SPOR domain-containing protein [Bacteroidetes bacterium]|jgi:hypothetical protein|nr:SPOR domain-containing protein [Bacteroidota bacterium]